MSSKQIRILNVDDNQVQRYTTTRMLTSAGFEVVEASTAKEALSRAGSNVDLIILDVDLPDIDGFQLTRTLKTQAPTANIPIISGLCGVLDVLARTRWFAQWRGRILHVSFGH